MTKINVKLDSKAKNVISKTAGISGGSGTKVVTELPDVGEEHIVYELRESKPASYNWVAMCTQEMYDDGCAWANNAGIALFDTYDQMMNTLNGIDSGANHYEGYCYLRTEDRLYKFYVEHSSWTFTEQEKITNYKFNMLDTNGEMNVIKSYEGYDETTNKFYGTLLDNTRVELGYDGQNTYYAFIPHQATYDFMDRFTCNGQFNFNPVTQLPTAQEAVANYFDELVENEGWIAVKIEGQLKWNSDITDNYSWVQELENFYQPWEEGAEPTEIYTGELEWEDVSSPTFDTIPYQEIIKMEISDWLFKPWTGGDKVSYWYYTEGEWVNMDEVQPDLTRIPVTYENYISEDNKFDITQFTVMVNGTSYTPIKYAEWENNTENPGCVSRSFGYIEIPKITQDNLTSLIYIDVHPEKVGGHTYSAYWCSEIPNYNDFGGKKSYNLNVANTVYGEFSVVIMYADEMV